MSRITNHKTRGEDGFTLIELLVVILIIGILAAIAIPSFLSQRSKATDSAAKELARTAETTAETYSTDNGGTYKNISPSVLSKYESTIQTAAGNNNAYLSAATEEAGGLGYTVTVTSVSGHTFSIVKKSTGVVERLCTPTGISGAAGGGCQNGTW